MAVWGEVLPAHPAMGSTSVLVPTDCVVHTCVALWVRVDVWVSECCLSTHEGIAMEQQSGRLCVCFVCCSRLSATCACCEFACNVPEYK